VPENAMTRLNLSRTVAPSDTSTSNVIAPAGPQIDPGPVGVASHTDIAYATRTGLNGRSLTLRLDLLIPRTPGAKPLVIYVPGGGFTICHKEMALERRTFVAEAGYAVASVQYRTVGDGATYRDTVADVKSAIRFLRANARHYGIDTSQIAVWGESAGGYLAAMVGATGTLPEFEPPDHAEVSCEVQAVIDYFGPSDLSRVAADFDEDAKQAHLQPGAPVAAFVFGPGTTKSLADEPAVVAAADPARYVTAKAPPFLLFHGSNDVVVSPSQTLGLHNTLIEHGVESTRYVLTGAGHGDIAVILAGLKDELPPGVDHDDLVAGLGGLEGALPWTTKELLGHVTEFLGKHLSRTAPSDYQGENR